MYAQDILRIIAIFTFEILHTAQAYFKRSAEFHTYQFTAGRERSKTDSFCRIYYISVVVVVVVMITIIIIVVIVIIIVIIIIAILIIFYFLDFNDFTSKSH